MTRTAPLLGPPLGLFALLALAACQQTDPYVRQGLWRPIGANDANLRAMIANPADLGRGRGGGPSSGDAAALAVARLRNDATKPLADSAIGPVKPNGSGAAPGAPSAGAGGGGGGQAGAGGEGGS